MVQANLPFDLLETNQINELTRQWVEIQAYIGEHAATVALIQLSMDCLMHSCQDAHNGSFQFPYDMDLNNIKNWEIFITNQICGRHFEIANQCSSAEKFAKLLHNIVRVTDNLTWMKYTRIFFREMAQHQQTVFLIAQPIVYWFIAIKKLSSNQTSQTFNVELKSICEHLSFTIEKYICNHGAINLIATSFLEKITENQNVLDQEGCLRIVVMFTAYLDDDINLLALTTISNIMNQRNNKKMVDLCSTQTFIDALDEILIKSGSNKILQMAFKLAIDIQKQPCNLRKKLFTSKVFRYFLIEAHHSIQKSAAELFYLMFNNPNGDNSIDFLVFLTRYHMKYRTNYTSCTTSMINAFQSFFDISNNWEMVFYAFDQNLKDEQFLCELFNITNIILKNIINKNIDDDKLKTFEHLAIEELAKICKKCAHAEMFLLRWIYAFDISLRNCNPNDLALFANAIDNIALDYFSTTEDQSIVLEFYRNLIIMKNVLKEEDLQERIMDKFNKFNQMVDQYGVELGSDINFDDIPDLMKSTFHFAMLTRYFPLSSSIKRNVFDQAYKLVIGKPFDKHKNRDFIAYCIVIMAESSISFDANSIDADKIREITKYLVGILQNTENDTDALSEVALVSLCKMECKFTQYRTSLGNLQILPDYVYHKVSLSREATRNGYGKYNHRIHGMLQGIGCMLRSGKELDVKELIANVFMEYSPPYYKYALELLGDTAKRTSFSLFIDCALHIFTLNIKMKQKEVFALDVHKLMDVNIPGDKKIDMRNEFKRKAVALFGLEARSKLSLKKKQLQAESSMKAIYNGFIVRWQATPTQGAAL